MTLFYLSSSLDFKGHQERKSWLPCLQALETVSLFSLLFSHLLPLLVARDRPPEVMSLLAWSPVGPKKTGGVTVVVVVTWTLAFQCPVFDGSHTGAPWRSYFYKLDLGSPLSAHPWQMVPSPQCQKTGIGEIRSELVSTKTPQPGNTV